MNAYCLLLGIFVTFGVNVLSSRGGPTMVFNSCRCGKLIAFLTPGIIMTKLESVHPEGCSLEWYVPDYVEIEWNKIK